MSDSAHTVERSKYETPLAIGRTQTGLGISNTASRLTEAFNTTSKKGIRSYTDNAHQLSVTPTPPARRHKVRKHDAHATPVSTSYSTSHNRHRAGHLEQELPVAPGRTATRDYSDSEESKYVPVSSEDDQLNTKPDGSGLGERESTWATLKFEELDYPADHSDAVRASPKFEDLEAAPDRLDTEYSRSTRNTPEIEDLHATPRCSDTEERISISTSPEAERDATHVSGVAKDHVSDTVERISISTSPEAEDRNVTHASSVAEDQDSGTKALPDGVYEIEGLRGKQWSAGKLWLKIKWKSLPSPSWELAEHMRKELGDKDYEELLQTMPRKRRKKAPKW
jgi:hypothetical protein